MHVYLLWHARHASHGDGADRHQQTLDGSWYADEEAGDGVTLLGVYSTRDKANDRVERARTLPGYRDEPDCFLADQHEVDRDEWTEGYVVI
jgi:hypothetical protein